MQVPKYNHLERATSCHKMLVLFSCHKFYFFSLIIGSIRSSIYSYKKGKSNKLFAMLLWC